MADIRRTWPLDTFDAIAIFAASCDLEVEGTDGQEVVLEGESESSFPRDPSFHSGQALDVQQTGPWLRVQALGRAGETELRLWLPRQKPWVLEFGAAQGDVQIRGVQARTHVNLGKGNVEIKDSQGVFAVHAGKGNVRLERCAEAAVPERPAMPQPEMAAAGTVGAFAWACGPGEGWPGFGPGAGRRWRAWVQDWIGDLPWQEWVGTAWEKWGQFLGATGQGVNVGLAKGDVTLRDVNARSCQVGIGSGDFDLHGGQVDGLQAHLGHGDVNCDAAPAAQASWSIDTKHGDIQLDLPADAEARLDVATRHGEIRSDFPLVRTSRPGPEARHGRRMVGAIGQGDNPAQISLSTVRGDITIRRVGGARAETREPGEQGSREAEEQRSGGAEEQAPAGPGDGPQPVVDARLAILESLSRGEITVEEAARLLERT